MEYTKHWKPDDRIDVGEPLPPTDCYVAPCVSACAIKQDIPEYIRLMGEQRYADALEPSINVTRCRRLPVTSAITSASTTVRVLIMTVR